MRSLCGVLVLFVAALTAGLWLVPSAPADNQINANVGKKIANIPFTDVDGKTTHLYDLKGKKAIVLVFLSSDCPVSKSYSQPLAEMADDLKARGVAFVGLTTNHDETPLEVVKFAAEFKLPFPVVLDRNFAATDAVAAKVTPEAFVLDGDFVLRYRGRIDDAYFARLKRHQQVSEYNLRQALEELVSGRPVSVPATEAIGCSIGRDIKASVDLANVTYYKDVLPILQKNCQECHRPGEVGPFSLMTYRQAVNWATDIKDYTRSRQMPPWSADPQYGPYLNDRSLRQSDIDTIVQWADHGALEGDAKDAPPPVQ